MKETLDAVLADKGAKVHCVVPGATVLAAVRKMNEEHIGALLVCDGSDVLGIFTERDILCRVTVGLLTVPVIPLPPRWLRS